MAYLGDSVYKEFLFNIHWTLSHTQRDLLGFEAGNYTGKML
jgi:hypothetical protein